MLNLYNLYQEKPPSRRMSESTVTGTIMKWVYHCFHWYLSIFSWVTVLLRRAFFYAREELHTAQQHCELYIICCFILHDVTLRMWKSCALLSILFLVPISSRWEIRQKSRKLLYIFSVLLLKDNNITSPLLFSNIHKTEFMQNRWSNVQF